MQRRSELKRTGGLKRTAMKRRPAKIIAGDPTGDRDHRDPLWASVPEGR